MNKEACETQGVDNSRYFKTKVKYYKYKHNIEFIAFAIWWRFLHLTKLARPYSKALCKFNLYRKFSDGRCHWCGEVH